MPQFHVRKVAVLGAGVMGAQIAAHLVNVRVPVLLFDLSTPGPVPQAIAVRAIEGLKKIKPAPLALADAAQHLHAAHYDADLTQLRDCDLVIEAIAERMDWKLALYQRIAPHLAPHAIVASNTSGLSITQLSAALPQELRERFCGIHFFNPPRYMTLVELIPTAETAPALLDALETFVTSTLGKGVVRAKDTPNFIANRVGVAGLLATMLEARKLGLGYDVVDDLSGKKLGRAGSGTFRTADVVGLDTLAHVIRTLQDTLSPEQDPFYASYATPAELATLVQRGQLGQKTGAGFFRKVGRDILRFDPATGDYVAGGQKADAVYARMLQRPAPERLRLLHQAEGAQGRFLWAVLRNSFHYAAVHLEGIADNARDLDLCMRWGFGMEQGPFELWQEAGWSAVAQMVQQDIDAGLALCRAPLPDWVFAGPVADAGGVHTPQGSWSPAARAFVAPRTLPVYARQIVPQRVYGASQGPARVGQTLFENAAIRVWSLPPTGPAAALGDSGDALAQRVLVASIQSKMHTLGPEVLRGLLQALDLAEREYCALVIWSPDAIFSAGADLQVLLGALMQGGVAAVTAAQQQMQDVMQRVRYASVPVVAALRGLVLGGGCELALHCSRRVAHLESYVGLVEVGVGLVPGAGGLTALARRAAERAAASGQKELLAFLQDSFSAAAKASVSTSAPEARSLGYLDADDVVVAHADELLFVAVQQARALAASGYRAPLPARFAVAGRGASATLHGALLNLREGGFISAHDYRVAGLLADVLCGGDLDAGTPVTESYLLALERAAFAELLALPATQDRIMAMLSTGKPLRN